MRKGLKIFFKITVTVILAGIFGIGALFAYVMVVCGGGGSLTIIIPIAIVVIPVFYQLIKFIWKKKDTKKIGLDTKQMTMSKNEIALVHYITYARNAGISDNEIKGQLLAHSWSDDEIDHAFGLTLIHQ